MRYREKIQELIKTIQSIYDDAEWLRDIATEEEKPYWNEVRRIFYAANEPLGKLDNKLTQSRADMEI
jgi:hypothetical protein